MKLIVLYRPNSEHSTTVENYIKDFTRLHKEITAELVDIDNIEGINKAQVYDILQYPAIIVTSDDGALQNVWSDGNLPLMDEVMGYMNS